MENKIIWEGQRFTAIKKFDCIVVDLQVSENGGGYFTCIPISPLSFRKSVHSISKAAVYIKKKEDYTEFMVVDDWGMSHFMQIPNSMEEEINSAIQSAIENELLKEME